MALVPAGGALVPAAGPVALIDQVRPYLSFRAVRDFLNANTPIDHAIYRAYESAIPPRRLALPGPRSNATLAITGSPVAVPITHSSRSSPVSGRFSGTMPTLYFRRGRRPRSRPFGRVRYFRRRRPVPRILPGRQYQGVTRHVANTKRSQMMHPRFVTFPRVGRQSAQVKLVGDDVVEDLVTGNTFSTIRILNGISQSGSGHASNRDHDRILNLSLQTTCTITNWGTSTTGQSIQSLGAADPKNFAADWNEVAVAVVYSNVSYAAVPPSWADVFSKPGTLTFRNPNNTNQFRVLWARRFLFTGSSTRYSIAGTNTTDTVVLAGTPGAHTKEYDDVLSINLTTVFLPNTPTSPTQASIEKGAIFWMASSTNNCHVSMTFRLLFIDQDHLMPSKFPPATF